MSFVWVLALSALNGFVALSYEVLWYRTFSFVGAGAAASFGLLLGFFLLGLGLGSLLGSDLCRTAERQGRPKQALTWLAAVMAAGAVLAYLVIPCLARVARSNWMFGYAGVVLATTAMGCLLPLIVYAGVKPEDRVGPRVASIYVANIVGSAAGSLTTGFFWLDYLSVRGLSVSVALIGLAGAAIVRMSGPRAGRAPWLAVLAALATGVIASSPVAFDRVYERLQRKTRFDPARPLFSRVVENRHGVVTVTRDNVVYGGGIYDGMINTSLIDDRNQIRRAYLLAAMHPRPRRVFMVGLSTGSWAEVIARLPGVEELTIVEINPAYIPLVRERRGGAQMLDDPRVKVIVDDGRRWLLRHPGERFDLIVMNTTFHFRSHATSLLSREFMDIARAHLAPGGLFYFNTTASLESLRTAVTAFPYALRVMGFVAISEAPLRIDRDRFAGLLDTLRIDGETRQRLLSWTDPASYGPGGNDIETGEEIKARTADVGLITDDNMASEWKDLILLVR